MIKIKRIFIANRGEIARRIAMTAERLGIETVVPLESNDGQFYLRELSTFMVRLEDPTPASYLDGAKMISLALENECDAIHPGFGFLSENAQFAKDCVKAGLIWIGPDAAAIEQLASKANARKIAIDAGVPCLDALDHLDISAPDWQTRLREYADQSTFPLIIKAALGGGGKGMRIAKDVSELIESAERAASEALNSFGDQTLVVEPYVQSPRHVEVQIFGDCRGDAISIGDRDCSIQRRHQKIVEESPAPFLSDKTRVAMANAAVQLAKSVNYRSAGTVEFLVDWSEKSRNSAEQSFYFLEMNTRLQVEHPVTEEVFGVDLVEAQIRVAQDEVLQEVFDQPLIERGHSIEVRIYAEDPAQNFMPQPGCVAFFQPFIGRGMRWEIGLDRRDEVTGRFDPMIGKLVVTANNRQTAIKLLQQGIKHSVVSGVTTNLKYVGTLIEHGDFASKGATTGFIGQFGESLLTEIERERTAIAPVAESVIAAIKDGKHRGTGIFESSQTSLLEKTQLIFGRSGGQLGEGGIAEDEIIFETEMVQASEALQKVERGRWSICSAKPHCKGAVGAFSVTSSVKQTSIHVHLAGFDFTKVQKTAEIDLMSGSNNESEVLAPVPGKVIAVKINDGARVTTGQTLFILESMKMEFEVCSPIDGEIDTILVSEQQQVDAGEVLIKWTKAPGG
jgi:acetyl/propionyl-CoA carboxylase alpha subunit